MFILYPHSIFHRIYDIPADYFREKGITTLLLDIDNTLTGDNDPMPNAQALEWLEVQHQAGMRLMVLSNNYERRVKPFAESLGLEYIAEARKPFPGNLKKALSQLGVETQETAVIGDQIFTDILCARLAGCLAVLVEPMAIENYGFYRVKRRLEIPVLKGARRRLKR